MYCVLVLHTKLSIDELNIEKSIHNYGLLKRQKSQFEHKYQIQQLLENIQLTTQPTVAVPTTKTFRQLQYYTLILLLFYCYHRCKPL